MKTGIEAIMTMMEIIFVAAMMNTTTLGVQVVLQQLNTMYVLRDVWSANVS